ncbi:FG-GAP-like repeat-containing protein [Pseudoxanthomonas mexicana]|uniref:FG-GAP-like repeat-containing protein n=1 Tax=Pseudoxanthomonas mexicana TaxID=128785 RepID=UPI0028ABECCE|nr:FG-GAP-like repeat-containing protein [Pseudoxanthomonas mexicana]
MKLRIGACALVVALAGCSGGNPESGVAGMRGVASIQPSATLPAALPLARAIGASIANAPDRGALLSYPDKQKAAKQEGAYTWYPTAISEAHAFKAVATGEMTVPSPDGSQVKLRYERHVEEIDGNWTWIGRVVGGDPMQEAIITFGEKAVFGSIPQANGKPALSLQTRNGSVFAVQTDPSKVVSATKGHVDMMIPEAAALRSSMGAAVSQSAPVSQGATMVAQGAPQTSVNTIDVAIGYTPEFATANGGASGAATRLVFLINVGNQAFVNSDVNGYLRIVHALQVSYTNTNSNQTALSELTGSNGQSAVTVPASLAPLRTARDQYGADIAMLVRKFNTPENEGCGIAWLNGANQTAITAADAPWGYAVISDGYDQGTDGKTYYCADETLVHEAAHLMGSAHDRANSTNSSGGLQYGRYAYSFGYKTAAAAGNFYTVMAYGDTGQISHRIFSTPLKNTCGSGANLACGVANSEDNARSLNQTIPVVATFRATVVPFAGAVPNDFDGDKKSEVYWRNMTTGVNDLWVMNGATLSAAYPVHYEPNQTWVVIGTGDFNGDGKADVLWRNSTSGQVYIHFMSGINVLPTSGNSLAVPDQNWQIVAVADFDGDGLSDIYWRNMATGVNSLWLMNGLTPKSNTVVFTEANLAWKVVGAGDFDGDGFADLFWRNTSTGDNYVQFMKGNVVQGTSGYSDRVAEQAFQVVAIRDFNNDGKADLYWRNTTTGQNWMWTMDGVRPSRVTYVHYEPNQAWKVVNSGDYNGDGYMDLFWRNTSTGQTYVHLMQNTSILAASGMSTAVPNMSWQVVGR